MEVLPNERIVFTDPTWRINSHGRTDLSVAAGVRLLAISAATGLGKSTFIRSILNDRLRATVCAMSYRESIAKYQAQEWNLTNYKEDGAFTEHNVARISTCIHSITRIPTHMAYDIVVLDEADAIRMSLGDSTMDRRYHLVYQRLCGIMRSASLVILLQSDLSQDVVTWASDLCMVDAEDRSFVQRSCIMTPRRLYPMASSDDLGVVLAQLQHFYKSNWDPRRSRARFPTLVFCTQKTFAASLYAMFKGFCTPEQRPGIRLVTRDTCAQDDWVQGFIKDPNAETSGADIVFASPVLSAGLSLDCHYTAGFYFLHKGIIAHDAEYQMTQRLRHQARTDEMHAYVYAYIEKGCGDENLASKERLSQMYFSLVSTARTDAGMGLGLGGAGSFRLKIQAEAAAEFADSRNRHAWLWQERYNGHVLVKIGGAEVPITSSEAERANLLAVLNKYVRNRSICVANWHLEDPLADLRAVADGELHAEVASQVLFEASIKADMLMDALIRSNRFKHDILRDVAVRLQHECTAHHAPWLGAFAFDRWLSLVLFETGLKKDPWKWRSKAIGGVSRHASALAGSELLRAMQKFLYTDFAIDGDRDLGIIAPGDTIDLSEGSEDERRIMEFRLRCANPQSAEYRLWNATNQKKIVAGDKGVYNTAYKFIKRVYHLGCGVPLRRSADGSGATWSSDYLNCTVLALLATRQDSLIEDWHMLRSYDLDCAVERAEAILDEWSHSNVMPMDVEDVEDVEDEAGEGEGDVDELLPRLQ
ncbi:hypothetical protein MVLG_07232 [Microbotryum lychnidis-dioicae p1A1 Lamole]|uniref:Replication origin-binding protein domain-containing protein n=1 Tax=Microbotryum lychnidis-dioicae (strain p1A1 Lamole / MvSl-1064) TaxID=683840 RepID=U5HJQ3_USTV1|nr:hypothetical protein MVLG_07232 [Microbotryum lychnidis-dioicae p1A1 Lamole]|eukprot:KDE02198.1 hypothetical protein MVLG_07232 [Microbotryum lychnidis-dioicae p1A1 Lamole]